MEPYLKLIEKELHSYNFGQEPALLYEPIEYILSLGGKRIRPIFTLMACSLFDDHVNKALYPALAVEVFHNFTLIHDDIMDKAPLRRSKATVHQKWNDNVAILSGDVMLIKAYELMAKVDDVHLSTLMHKFNQSATDVCEGQQYDMNFETVQTVSESEYIEMIRLKTAVLLAFSLEIGAIVGGARADQATQMRDFGMNIGIGFQLKDDLLDVFGDAEKFGKQVGGDIISNKKTYLLIKALELAQGDLQIDLQEWINKKEFNPVEKVNAVKSIYDQLGIKAICEQKMNYYFDKGLEVFNTLEVSEDRKNALRKLTTGLINREK